jgi:hypothetical protein
MQGANNEASIPIQNERNGERTSVRRKFANLLEYFSNPFSTKPAPQDEDAPAAKRPRLQASTSRSRAADTDTVVDAHAIETATTASPNYAVAIAPTDTVTVAASLPSTGALRARIPRSAKKAWIQASTSIFTGEDSEAEDSEAEDSETEDSEAEFSDAEFSDAEVSDVEVSDANVTDTLVASPDGKVAAVAPTYAVAVAASLPSSGALRARIPRSAKKAWIQASTSSSTGEDSDAQTIETSTTASPDDTVVAVAPTTTVTVAVASYRVLSRNWWNPEEDAMLTDAVKELGKDWAAVAAIVPGRTNDQCRRRWSKYLGPAMDSVKWMVEEDAKLTDAQTIETATTASPDDTVAVAPTITATVAATSLPSSQAPRAVHRKRARGDRRIWDPEEDAILTDAVEELGKDWAAVAARLPGRKSGQCHHRWATILNPATGQTMARWTTEEDEKLIDAVTECGCNNWVRVAALVPCRTRKQCRRRWCARLDPDINTCKWTEEEDAKLTKAVTEFCNDWVRVAALVPGRTNDQCRHRWVMCLVVKWTVEEDKKLAQAVRKHRRGDWVRVAALVPGRTKGQCCKRWATSFTWTVEEDAKLTKAVRKHRNNWIRVAALVPGRSNAQCCRRWTKYLTPESPYNINREPDDS